MIVRIRATASAAGAAVELLEASDFSAFAVELEAGVLAPGGALEAAGAGRLDGAGAIVAVSWIRANAPDADSADWSAGLAGMLRYAESKGWTADDGDGIRAHIEAQQRDEEPESGV